MKAGALASLSGIAAITVLGASYLTFGVVRADPFADFTHASLHLENSAGLAVGAPILLTGIEIGKVTAVTAAPDRGVDVEVGPGHGRAELAVRVGTTEPSSQVDAAQHAPSVGPPRAAPRARLTA